MHNLVDGDHWTIMVPESGEYRAAFFVDLGSVYELSSIHLYGQSKKFEDRIGLNVPFSLFTWANYTPICDVDLQYPWNLVKGGLRFTRDMEKLVLPGPMTAQYIIVMMDRRDPGTKVDTLIMSEIEAFGRKIRNAYVPPTPRFGIRSRNKFDLNVRSAICFLFEKQCRMFRMISTFQMSDCMHLKQMSIKSHVSFHSILQATLAEKLKMGAQSWSYFKTERIFNPDQTEDLTTTGVQTAIRQIIDNYGEYFTHNAPCDWKPYIIANSTLTAMSNYNNVILSQR
ncbi:hypothetical protein PHET_11387, partial [Paragonimus heterotremus]